jgi:hypothetical protein
VLPQDLSRTWLSPEFCFSCLLIYSAFGVLTGIAGFAVRSAAGVAGYLPRRRSAVAAAPPQRCGGGRRSGSLGPPVGCHRSVVSHAVGPRTIAFGIRCHASHHLHGHARGRLRFCEHDRFLRRNARSDIGCYACLPAGVGTNAKYSWSAGGRNGKLRHRKPSLSMRLRFLTVWSSCNPILPKTQIPDTVESWDTVGTPEAAPDALASRLKCARVTA